MSSLLSLFLLLFEKLAVIVAVAFVLSAARPFQTIVLSRASWLRRAVILGIFSLISVWGSHLGLEILGVQANNRAVGILVAGLLGGPWVGGAVGLIGGGYFALVLQPTADLAPFFLLASVMDGVLAGLWGRRHRTSRAGPGWALLIALAVQLVHLAVVGLLLLALRPEVVLEPWQRHLVLLPELAENALGVALFVAIVRASLRLRQLEVDLAQQEAATARAQLQALQAQIRPHFLFNTLNTISYLIRTSPERARALVAKLAGLYRYLLHPLGHPVTLGEEVEQVRRYLEIEAARFGDRLTVEFDVGEAARGIRVPALILQPVVENAVKHGISPLPEGGTVRVEAEARQGWLTLRVEDDGRGFGDQPWGTGLANVARRVEVVGRAQGELRIESRQGEGTAVTLRLPIDPDAPGPLQPSGPRSQEEP